MDLTIEIAKRVTLASTGLRPELAHSLRSRLANLSCREVSLAPGQVADIYLVESSELMPEISSSARQMLALNLLRKGWKYVADDKFLLEDGVAHSYQQSLLLPAE